MLLLLLRWHHDQLHPNGRKQLRPAVGSSNHIHICCPSLSENGHGNNNMAFPRRLGYLGEISTSLVGGSVDRFNARGI